MASDFLKYLPALTEKQENTFQAILQAAASIPQEKLAKEFGETINAYVDNGVPEVTAYALVRVQITQLLSDAFTEMEEKKRNGRIVKRWIATLVLMIGSLIVIGQRHSRRLRTLEGWRAGVIVGLAELQALFGRTRALEQAAALRGVDVGPEIKTDTSGTGTFVIAHMPLEDRIGVQRRIFCIEGHNADGSAYYYGTFQVLATLVSGAAVLGSGALVGSAYTSAATISAAASGTVINIRTSGETGADIKWSVVEIRSLPERPDPNYLPIY